MSDSAKQELNKARRILSEEQGRRSYILELFGDHLAASNGYRSIDGIEALHFFLMQRHHWLPAQVRSLSVDDLWFAVTEDLAAWRAPKDAGL